MTGRCCRECGASFSAKRDTREYCDASCRRTWNNRRVSRGAILFDAVMAWRFERNAFEEVCGRRLFSQLASVFRAEDERQRAGRRSWDDARRVKQRNPEIFASVVIGTNVAGNRRSGAAQ
jgi:hypothetical protein